MGGKETGQSCSHYIVAGGPYARAFAELAAQPDFSALYVELWDDADARKKRKAKSASKSRYTCPSCALHAWANPARAWFAASATSRWRPRTRTTINRLEM